MLHLHPPAAPHRVKGSPWLRVLLFPEEQSSQQLRTGLVLSPGGWSPGTIERTILSPTACEQEA